jgi:hypothetical protein
MPLSNYLNRPLSITAILYFGMLGKEVHRYSTQDIAKYLYPQSDTAHKDPQTTRNTRQPLIKRGTGNTLQSPVHIGEPIAEGSNLKCSLLTISHEKRAI